MQAEKDGALEKEFVIRNKLGLHARPAALFVQTAGQFKCDIQVKKGEESVNGKSIMGIMTLAVETGTTILVCAKGSDAQEALDALTNLIDSDFGE